MRRRQDYGVMGLGKAEFKGLGGNSPNFLGLHILRGEHFPGK